MTSSVKSLFVSLFIAIILQGCSTPLQSSRLNTAEDNIIQAERALASSQIRAAESFHGTAMAYLATLADFKKFMTINEEKRFQALNQREKRLSQAIRSRK